MLNLIDILVIVIIVLIFLIIPIFYYRKDLALKFSVWRLAQTAAKAPTTTAEKAPTTTATTTSTAAKAEVALNKAITEVAVEDTKLKAAAKEAKRKTAAKEAAIRKAVKEVERKAVEEAKRKAEEKAERKKAAEKAEREAAENPFRDSIKVGKVFPYKYFLYIAKNINSMKDCIHVFNNPRNKRNKSRVGLIQYNKKKKYCFGQNTSNIHGHIIDQPEWSALDLRPGYLAEGKYNI